MRTRYILVLVEGRWRLGGGQRRRRRRRTKKRRRRRALLFAKSVLDWLNNGKTNKLWNHIEATPLYTFPRIFLQSAHQIIIEPWMVWLLRALVYLLSPVFCLLSAVFSLVYRYGNPSTVFAPTSASARASNGYYRIMCLRRTYYIHIYVGSWVWALYVIIRICAYCLVNIIVGVISSLPP